jgi:hypothetical protein
MHHYNIVNLSRYHPLPRARPYMSWTIVHLFPKTRSVTWSFSPCAGQVNGETVHRVYHHSYWVSVWNSVIGAKQYSEYMGCGSICRCCAGCLWTAPCWCSKMIKRCSLPGSNWWPSDYETDALPTEPKERHANLLPHDTHKNNKNSTNKTNTQLRHTHHSHHTTDMDDITSYKTTSANNNHITKEGMYTDVHPTLHWIMDVALHHADSILLYTQSYTILTSNQTARSTQNSTLQRIYFIASLLSI